ncbi:type II secretion system minor pseudopilin GspI [Psychrobacter sp. I-STPA10]|uniref:type II secretion system minor pseudopilin GspI n=1 Tax=Psychrobacter sp. I-STPA10 TaxID=2585769 RepID=UPI001E2E9024|nr:type II secretion system minor pseudopilin GspI [Psychrobacter sp. I-STPA10]
MREYRCSYCAAHFRFLSNQQTFSQNFSQQRQKQGGFTLIEVMVALAILAVVAIVASQASGTYLRSVDNLKTQTLAHFVAQNAGADLKIHNKWLTAQQSQQVSSQGRDWQVVLVPQPMAGIAVENSLQIVNIQVAPVIDGQVKNNVTDLNVVIKNPQN